ncbi:hypothetical protein PVAND_003933 [Polypedilum vanderplanki]|uniref:Uncharacterized protein n=1 Tax=Polypedilum vanderplanki TaxID=319348 RepID=A0A9J6BVL6_POLVA|nr:hypothetical protein PVAND_003933 [Polypedilum vanderplanki]
MDFLRNILQIPSSVSVSMKIPKFKKLRQWSHDSIVNLSQLTARNAPGRQRQNSENPLPTTGITTISSAINEQKIDPKKDNFGLYALKCDRSQSLANARRGILLNLPTTSTKVKSNSFHLEERNHEVFQPCETLENDESNQRRLDEMNQQKPPPRKKKKVIAPSHINALHQKPKQQIYKAGQSTTIAMDAIEKNDSGLYKIVNATATANITYVEPKKKVAIVRPKVEKAIVVEMPKVKDYEWHKHQRRPSKSKVGARKLNEVSSDSKTSDVDIFKTNSSTNKQNIFDEFDELFEKNKREVEAFQTPELALKKLKELKTSSSSVSMVLVKKSGNEQPPSIKVRAVDNNKNLAARVKYVSTLLEEENYEIVDDKKQAEQNMKPKIVSEKMKDKQQSDDVNKKKIMYYNDENEMQEMIMKRVQTTKTSEKMSTMDVKDYGTERANLNENQTSVDYKHPTQLVSNISNSNSLRRTVFVFNL